MNNTCFVIMPYGVKKDIDGNDTDFNRIFDAMIKDAVTLDTGLVCQRCDDIELPGWIHERMIRHIYEDRVAVVDTSTLNANVFYELGIRHALRKSITVLLHREGTTWPFNINGLSSINYETTPDGIIKGKVLLNRFIVNALNNPANIDSLVYKTIPDLRVMRMPKRITKVQVIEYSLVNVPDKRIGFVTGDREDITIGDIWVSSENTNMKMDHFYGKSTSATIRYLGARKNLTGKIVEDIIGNELAGKMGVDMEVDPGTVVVSSPGLLSKNNVRWIFHVAAVVGEPREGFRPIARLDQCVKNAIRKVCDDPEFHIDGGASILFPIFGTGQGGGDLAEHAKICLTAAIEQLENTNNNVRAVYFYVWGDEDLTICQNIVRELALREMQP